MISQAASPSVRKGAAVAGIAGMLVLAGCSGAADAEPPADSGASTGSGTYVDGTYTAEGSYQTPETVEQISVTLTLESGIVADVEVTGDPQARETEQYQGQFIAGIAEEVEGRPIDELDVSRVAGSSLTSGGFNAAVEDIKDQAAA
ncbi:FMN-binding protein [Microbacterium abyssi]|uniref:FMN-binding protein n=1 Tax=Microbacterium abyssi TaxID=2782166 RepID=UPI001888106C|nr:FMN-binding protein [Microbacterium sp. A18JL241]